MGYSQNNEEEVIINHFLGKTNGVFLDLGANDGVTLSNTRALFERGWKGALVDASPKAFERLKDLYRGVNGISVYHLALTSYDGMIMLKDSGKLIGENDIALVSTVHDHEVDRFKSAVRYNDVEVPCFTWDTFIKACPYKLFDFVSVDIEGCELDILPYMDLSITSLVCIEWNCKEEVKKEYDRILKDFRIIHSNQENLIYVR